MAERLREAVDEMTSAAWYEEQREGPGDRFLDVVRATILHVDATPRAGVVERHASRLALSACCTGVAPAPNDPAFARDFRGLGQIGAWIENPRVGSSILSLGTENTAVSRGFERDAPTLVTLKSVRCVQ